MTWRIPTLVRDETHPFQTQCKFNDISTATVDVSADAAATEAADADIEAAGVVDKPIDTATADIVATGCEEKSKHER